MGRFVSYEEIVLGAKNEILQKKYVNLPSINDDQKERRRNINLNSVIFITFLQGAQD
jgi:hypothetical protein